MHSLPLCVMYSEINLSAFVYPLQLLLIVSGNLSFLNWITILPCIACFDDASLAWLFSSATKWQVYKLQQASKSTTKAQPKWSECFMVHACVIWCISVCVISACVMLHPILCSMSVFVLSYISKQPISANTVRVV